AHSSVFLYSPESIKPSQFHRRSFLSFLSLASVVSRLWRPPRLVCLCCLSAWHSLLVSLSGIFVGFNDLGLSVSLHFPQSRRRRANPDPHRMRSLFRNLD